MFRFLRSLLSYFGLSSQPPAVEVVPPRQFTEEFAAALQQEQPEYTVAVADDLALAVTTPAGQEYSLFLANAYQLYTSDPKQKPNLFRQFIASAVESAAGFSQPIDETRIVPVIKDRAWLAETRQTALTRGGKSDSEPYAEDYNADLLVLYAEDSPHNIRYLSYDDLRSTEVDFTQLREIACDNLINLLPKVELRGGNGMYMVVAGGNYEASLMLVDSLWTSSQIQVAGAVVIAIPARDLLLVTGSENPDGLQRLREFVAEIGSDAPYRITDQLFIYRKGIFEPFDDDDT